MLFVIFERPERLEWVGQMLHEAALTLGIRGLNVFL
jgi:hypothetical protein